MRAQSQRFALGFAALITLTGVVSSGCERNDSAKAEAPKIMLDALPSDAKALEIDYDGKLKLVGYKLNTRGPMRPGRNVSVTLYWRADKKLDAGFRLASRLVDGSGETVQALDDASPLRAQKDGRLLHDPKDFTPGKVYVDELSFNVPRNVKTTKVQLLASVAKGEQRIRVTAGPSTDATSGVVLSAPTGFRPRQRIAPPPKLRVDKLEANAKIKIDGKLDEAAWQSAEALKFVDTASGAPNPRFPLNGTFRILWSKEGFYIGADLKDADIVGGFAPDQKDPHLWTKDALMLMVDPEGDGDNVDYYEIQIGPQNLVYDTHYDTLNEPHKDPDGPFGHEEWTSKLKSAVTVTGTIDKRDDKDEGYVIEALIPWKSFDKVKKTPPDIGSAWRINVFAMRDGRGVGWSPLLGKGTLHKASRFGQVLWAEKGYVEPAAPAASASAAAGEAKPGADEAKAPADEAPEKANLPEGDTADESPDGANPARARVPIGAQK